MYVIKLNEEELSFLFNNLEAYVENHAKGHTWFQLMDNLCWDETKQAFKPENPLILNEEQRDEFYQDMVCDSEEILRQLGIDVRYHSLNDSSWSNSKWCLEIISGILCKIQHAEVVE
jgi:hypothetical protein